ncbi:MAG: hypothetical protein CMG75_10425 [Candidatus Marinimicrobia bacterium]|nr:hypothetical protein [Candidatus Neomarinimicrobiota bacterium]|tara:strand:+ start:21811 stop:22218 length:408 start_codon:yes stop_codon:yes gene_type:complete
MKLEKRLKELKRMNWTQGIPDSFLSDLKNEVIFRNRKRQDLINSISAFMIIFAIGSGFYLKNLNVNDYDMSQIIIDLSGEVDSDFIFEEEDFVFASIDYLIDEIDLIESGWELIDDFTLYEHFERREINSFEERS